MSFDIFRKAVLGLGLHPEVCRVMSMLDRGVFSTSSLAYSLKDPAPILDDPPINMTAADLHAEALNVIYKHFADTKRQPKSALDVGTGTGYVATALNMLFPSLQLIKGIDILEPLITKARNIQKELGGNGILFERENVFSLDKSEKYDIIHGGATVHQDLKSMLEHLNPGGIMIMPFTTNNQLEVLGLWKKSLDNKLTGPEILGYVRYTPMVKEE